jgi:putative ABC transport system permease protein
LKPLPYPHADRIVALLQRPLKGEGVTPVHPRSFVEWRELAQSFEALTIAQNIPVNTQGIGGAEQVSALWTTSELFRVFGVAATLGRVFADEEGLDRSAVRGESSAGTTVVVLSHGYWQRRFGSNPQVLGQRIPIGRGSAVVIGVMPADFRVGNLTVDLYVPLNPDRNRPETIGSRAFLCFGLLRPGVTLEAAGAEMATIADEVGRLHPVERDWGVLVVGLRDYLVRDNRLILFLLLGVVALVLLIACANLAGLLLARGIGRRGEFALRASLGAGRSRLVQQLIIESLAISAAGGALGLLLGSWATRALVLLAEDAVAFGQMADAGRDARVFAFTAVLAVLTAITFGLVPAWQASQFDLQPALKQPGRGADSRGPQRLRAALVVGEVALAVMLLIGAGLLIRTFSHLLQVKLGFQPEDVLTLRLFITGEPAKRSSLVERVLDRVETLPDVAAGTIQFLPLGGFTTNGPFHFVGRPKPADPMSMESDVSTVSRGYFAAMRIPVVRGRPFGRQEQLDSPRAALVNQSFVNKYSPTEDAIGRVIIGDWANPKPTTIVGVVGDVRHNSLTAEPRPTVFLAQAQVPGFITHIIVRTASDPERLTAAIRRAVIEVDPNQPVTNVQTMQQHVAASLVKPRLYTVLLGTFASLALLLASLGLYGLMAYLVSQRTHEIGIRLALGARPSDVFRDVFQRALFLTLAGLAGGVSMAVVAQRLISTFLFGVTGTDPVTYGAAAGVFALVILAAASGPAWRAARVNPMKALRCE